MAIFYKLEGLAGPMASKKGGTGKRFQFPKFEREAFLEKEVRDAKVSFISLGLASVMVIISLVLATSVHVGPAILIGFMGPFALYFLIPAAGIDTSEFERKNWFGPGMITFFAWLGLFILLSNPPFQDLADPTIDHFKVYQQDPDSGNWTRLETPANNTYTVTNGTFVIVLRIMDNWQLDRYGITLEGAATGVKSPELQVLGQGNNYSVPMRERDEDSVYYVHLEDLEAGTYTVTVTAVDVKDNTTSREWTLVVE